MTPRSRLLWQLSISSSIILAVLSLSDLGGPFPLAPKVEAVASMVCAVTAWFARRGGESTGVWVLLGTIQAVLLLFDDGFGGIGQSWVIHIPVLLAAIALSEPRKPREPWIWVGITTLNIGLVNLTGLTPHWNRITIVPSMGPSLVFLNFLVAGSASWLCLRFLQQAHVRLLDESRELAHRLQGALEKAEQASLAKGDFLSHMSHELRTPLNALSGFAQILLQGSDSPSEAAENLQAIRTSADHLVHLVGDVLDLSRMEHGNLVLSRTPFQPIDQMRMVHSILIHSAREKDLSLELDIQGAIGWIEGDPVRWRQILLNLGGNAVKYTQTGGVILRLSNHRDEDGVEWLDTEVVDTGPGIPADQQASIFRKFERLPEHEAGPIGGAGLGLAIARELAHSMGGTLRVESELGRGSRFILSIPAPRTGPPQTPSSDSWALPWNPSGFRVLLCEDNRLNIRLATQVLGRLGVEHEVAIDGQAAIDLLAARDFDIVLLDLHMPRRSGFEVARILRASDPPHRLADIPILALTADVSEETLQRTREEGMNDFLAKPFHLPELEERLRKLLSRRKPAPPEPSP